MAQAIAALTTSRRNFLGAIVGGAASPSLPAPAGNEVAGFDPVLRHITRSSQAWSALQRVGEGSENADPEEVSHAYHAYDVALTALLRSEPRTACGLVAVLLHISEPLEDVENRLIDALHSTNDALVDAATAFLPMITRRICDIQGW